MRPLKKSVICQSKLTGNIGMYWLTGNIDMYACPLLMKVALCGLVMQACQEKFALTFVWVIG